MRYHGAHMEIIDVSLPNGGASKLQTNHLAHITLLRVENYAFFAYRSLEIWQRLIPFTYACVDYDVATRCYARLAKLITGTSLSVCPEHVAPASHVTCNALYRLAGEDPKLCAGLLDEAANCVFGDREVMQAWHVVPGRQEDLGPFLARFLELKEAFCPAARNLWDAGGMASEARFKSRLQDLQSLGDLLDSELDAIGVE